MTAVGVAAPHQLRSFAERWQWQLSARCRVEDPSLFFHPDGERGRARRRRQQRAKAICAECPVALQCRAHSLMFREAFGTWGGVSEDERNNLLRPPIWRARPAIGKAQTPPG